MQTVENSDEEKQSKLVEQAKKDRFVSMVAPKSGNGRTSPVNISIADLLDLVNKYFLYHLPEDVLKH